MINRYLAMKNWQFSRYKRRNNGFYFAGHMGWALPAPSSVAVVGDNLEGFRWTYRRR